jgi:hypothetical protein
MSPALDLVVAGASRPTYELPLPDLLRAEAGTMLIGVALLDLAPSDPTSNLPLTIPPEVREKRCSVMFGTSTFLHHYARHAQADDFKSMRIVVAGAEKLADSVRQTWRERFGIDRARYRSNGRSHRSSESKLDRFAIVVVIRNRNEERHSPGCRPQILTVAGRNACTRSAGSKRTSGERQIVGRRSADNVGMERIPDAKPIPGNRELLECSLTKLSVLDLGIPSERFVIKRLVRDLNRYV